MDTSRNKFQPVQARPIIVLLDSRIFKHVIFERVFLMVINERNWMWINVIREELNILPIKAKVEIS